IDREAWRAVAGHRHTARILERLSRAPDVRGELLAVESEHPRMVVAVARELVAGLDDPSHQRAIALGHPAQREEGRLDPGFGEEFEDAQHVVLDAQREMVPIAARDYVLERADLEPVLDVDRQAVDDAVPLHARLLRPRRAGAARFRPTRSAW